MAKFAFWNVQRIGNMNPTSEGAAFRVGYFQAVFKDIITKYRPTFFVCAEVTSLGGNMQQWANAQGWFGDYVGEFVAVNHNANPCNFFVAKKKKDSVVYQGSFGSGLQRPYLALSATSGLSVAFAHLKSGGSEKTEDELLTVVTDLASRGIDAICGDLNLNFAKFFPGNSALKTGLAQLGYSAVAPHNDQGAVATYGKQKWLVTLDQTGQPAFTSNYVGKTLDFLVCRTTKLGNVVSTPYAHGGSDFDIIDHAPVLFQIKT
jgi:hypothetical protein